MEYKPPFSINDDIINLLAKTSELVGQVSILHKSSSLKLRRENRIKTIHSSLAIEHNSLSLEQVTAVVSEFWVHLKKSKKYKTHMKHMI